MLRKITHTQNRQISWKVKSDLNVTMKYKKNKIKQQFLGMQNFFVVFFFTKLKRKN